MVVKALQGDCMKAAFFEVGKHASWHPEITKHVVENTASRSPAGRKSRK
jgi:hypothetical protein